MTSKLKVKPALIPIRTRAEMELQMDDLRIVVHRRDQAKTDMDLALAKVAAPIRAQYQSTIDGCNESIALRQASLKAWADANAAEFGIKKSIETDAGTLGYRTGQPEFAQKSKWTVPKILTRIKELLLDSKYIRQKEEINKEAIIADREKVLHGPKGEYRIEDLGCRVTQTETFFIEVKQALVAKPEQERRAA